MKSIYNGHERLLHLDGLRGIAIGLVLIHHFVVPLFGNVPGSPGGYLGAAFTLSYTGVDLFFVLSGYLIGGILLDHRDSPRLFTTFYIRRAMRILPLAAACIAVILGSQAIRLYAAPEGGRPWPTAAYLLFATNLSMVRANDWGYRPLSHLWSLAIEEQFYLIAPWFICWLRPARTAAWLVSIILLAPLTRLAILAAGGASFQASMLPFCRMDCIGLGMMAAWIVRDDTASIWCKQHRRALHALCLLAALGCAVLTKLRAGNGGFTMAAGGYTVVAIFYVSILLLCETQRRSSLNRALAIPPLVLLGRYSYFLYLFQGIVIGLTFNLLFYHRLSVGAPTHWSQLFAGLVGLSILAAASWRWFESPFLALGRRVTY